jgi:hypothetical protein
MKNKIVILVVLIIFVLIGLVFAQYYIFKCRLPFLKTLLKCPPYIQPQAPDITTSENLPKPQKITLPKVLYNLAGSIQEIGTNFIVLDAAIPEMDDSGQSIIKKEIRKVLTTISTKFTRLTFIEKSGSTSKTPQETAIGLKDLEKGDYIEAVSNQDIWDKQEFEAILIRVLQK